MIPLNTDPNVKLALNILLQQDFFVDTSQTFGPFPDTTIIAVKIPDLPRFFRTSGHHVLGATEPPVPHRTVSWCGHQHVPVVVPVTTATDCSYRYLHDDRFSCRRGKRTPER